MNQRVQIDTVSGLLQPLGTDPPLPPLDMVRSIADETKPQFFRVMLPDFFSKLSLPIAFVKKHIKHEEVKEKGTNVTIISPNGKAWKVRLRRSDDESPDTRYFFQEGWLECTQTHQLKEGYLLLFIYDGDLMFSFRVFDHTTCIKSYPLLPSHHTTPLANGINRPRTRSQNMKVNNEMRDLSSSSRRPGLLPRFKAIIKKTSLRYLYLPKWFVNSGGFSRETAGRRSSLITLRDRMNRSWKTLAVHNRKATNRRSGGYDTFIKSGWRSFVSANKLKIGDTCIFEMADGEKGVLNVTILTLKT